MKARRFQRSLIFADAAVFEEECCLPVFWDIPDWVDAGGVDEIDAAHHAGLVSGYPDGSLLGRRPEGMSDEGWYLRALAKVEQVRLSYRLYRLTNAPPSGAEIVAKVRQSVVRVNSPEFGTAFCVAPGVLMTDWHVVKGGNVRVNNLDNPRDSRSCDWLKHDALLDFAAISDPFDLRPIPLAAVTPRNGDTLWSVGCGSGEPGTALRLTYGVETTNTYPESGSTALRRLIVGHGTVIGGDSGAPVVNDRGELVSPIMANKPGESRYYIAPLDTTASWLRVCGYFV